MIGSQHGDGLGDGDTVLAPSLFRQIWKCAEMPGHKRVRLTKVTVRAYKCCQCFGRPSSTLFFSFILSMTWEAVPISISAVIDDKLYIGKYASPMI